MDKNEFLMQLRMSLSGQIPEYEIQSNIRYYDNYISSHGSDSEKEKKCIDEIGDPRLIARTIIDAYEAKNGKSDGASQSYDSYYEEPSKKAQSKKHIHMTLNGNDALPWYTKLLLFIIPIGIIALILFIGIFLFRVVLRIALPIFLIVIVIQLVIRLFNK